MDVVRGALVRTEGHSLPMHFSEQARVKHDVEHELQIMRMLFVSQRGALSMLLPRK